MYEASVTDRYLELQMRATPSFKAERHSVADVEAMTSVLETAWEPGEYPGRGQQIRDLTNEENEFIINERYLCTHDFDYYTSRYCWINNYEKRLARFKPNVAQRAVLDIWAEMERNRWAIMMIQVKARQLGVSTLTELAVAHRTQFWPDVDAVVASSTPGKTEKLSRMIRTVWEHMPWWLMPKTSAVYNLMPREFGELNSCFDCSQSGNQFSGVSRGSTPNVFHGSELAEWTNPENDIDASLLNAIHETPHVLMILESTALGRDNWWHKKWRLSKEGWDRGTARLCPIFLPWFVGRDIYPDEGWLRKHPVPPRWVPDDLIEGHAKRAEVYVKANPRMRRILGEHWVMPIEQQWWYAVTREEYRQAGQLNRFLAECVAGESRISTDSGIIQIRDAARTQETETGSITAWWNRGERDVLKLTTKAGRELIATPEHLVQLKNGSWKQMAMLVSEDEIKLSPPLLSTKPYTQRWQWAPACKMAITVTPELSEFLGLFIGDGSWGSDSIEVTCCSDDPDTIQRCADLIKNIVGRPPVLEQKGRRCVRVKSHSVTWWEMLWNLGVLEPRIHKKQARRSGYIKKLRVPECIWRSPKNVVKSFLSGLFEADGHANRSAPQTTFFSKSPELMREIQLLLMVYGINADHRHAEKIAANGHKHTGRNLRLNAINSDLFHQEIGFIGQRKRSAPKRTSRSSGRKPIPIEFIDTVVAVTPFGRTEVFDVSVHPTQCFGANGIMVHNCPADDYESFQSTNHSIFTTEVISAFREKTREPEGVYKIVGVGEQKEDIPIDMRPMSVEVDANKPKIPIRCEWGPHLLHYELIPVKFEGFDRSPDGRIFIWEHPKDGYEYGVGVDTGDGIGQDGSVCEGLRKGTLSENDKQVFEMASPYINALSLWPWSYALGSYYATLPPSHLSLDGSKLQPRAVIDCLKAGEAVQHEMRKRGWWNFHQWMRMDDKKLRIGKNTKIGFFSNQWARSWMLEQVQTFINNGWIDIFSPMFIGEMESLEKDEYQQSARAAFGGHDDRIVSIGMLLFSWYVNETRGPKVSTAERRQAAKSEEDPTYDSSGDWQRKDLGGHGVPGRQFEIMSEIYERRR